MNTQYHSLSRQRLLAFALAVFSVQGVGAEPLAGPGAQSEKGQVLMQKLKDADINKDGKLSRSEAERLPRLAQRFDHLDADKDGQVTREEMRAARDKAQRFQTENFAALKEMESDSHQARIQILQQADACIKAATSPDAYRQCEQKEKESRQALRESTQSKRANLMATTAK